MEKKTWQEFRETGLLLLVNQLLHAFGYAVACEIDTNTGEVTEAFPARVEFRGFHPIDQEEAYKKLSIYMRDNAIELSNEAHQS